MADSLCYTAETNNIVKQLYSNKDVIKKKSHVWFAFVAYTVFALDSSALKNEKMKED